MKKKANKSQFYQTAGVFYAILAALQLSNLINYQSFGNIVFTAGYVLVAVPLLTKKKNKLPVIGFALLAAGDVLNVIGYLAPANILLNALDLAASLVMCYILLGYIGTPSAARKAKSAKLRMLPPVLTVIRGAFSIIAMPIIYGYSMGSTVVTSIILIIFEAMAQFYAADGIAHLEDAPAAASSAAPAAAEPDDTASEELKAYKSLLDAGIISQEEYDAKREELGL